MRANKRATPRRFSRRGTIMIMVVALLVLLMLIGTAWIATVSSDRGASQRHTFNNRTDLSAQALVQMIEATAGIGDLVGSERTNATGQLFRPHSDFGGVEDAKGNLLNESALTHVYSYAPWTCPIP